MVAEPILLLGPTASGKSRLALALADRFALEIISLDSAQVYRGLDLGTAKPAPEERARVSHHLIDLREPEQAYSVAQYVTDARAAVAAVLGRGRLPLIVGGTMLYARALLMPLDDLPAADPAVRAQLDAEAARSGWPALHRRLVALDPAAAARIAPNDAQRIQRALEVIELTGRPLSEQQLGSDPRRRPSGGNAALLEAGWPVIAIEPSDRAVLHRRIAERFDAMLAAGLVDEVRRLLQRPGLRRDLPAMRAVGYRQVADWLADGAPESGRAAMRERGIAATRQLAKRQLTWLRSLPVQRRLDCLSARLLDETDAAIRALLRRARPGRYHPEVRGDMT